jgi:hypothetical protein
MLPAVYVPGEFAVRRVGDRWLIFTRDPDPYAPAWRCIKVMLEPARGRDDWITTRLREIAGAAGRRK